MTDPFDALASPIEPQEPRPSFARALRDRLLDALDLDEVDATPTIDLPRRKPMPSTTTTPVASAVTPYLTAADAAAALDWYAEAFGAVEQYRIVGDDGRIGHAEFHIGSATFYLSDEHPEMGVVAPTSLGGTPFALHLQVADVDALYARAVSAGAAIQTEPADQAHGARHGSLLDPFGHRWMLSQHMEDVDDQTMAERMAGSGYRLDVASPGDRTATERGGIWPAVFYRDALAGIRFLVDVFGFEEQMVVTDPADPTRVVHSQMRWPEGGVLQADTYDPDNPFCREPGDGGGAYVITTDPRSVWDRCQAAGVEVIRPLAAPDHDPDGLAFSVRDPEGNTWSFGTYAGG